MHYIYEKQTSLTIRRRINEAKFNGWAHNAPAKLPATPDALIAYISEQHRSYVAQETHTINDDISHICCVLTAVVLSIIGMTCTAIERLPHIGEQEMVQTA